MKTIIVKATSGAKSLHEFISKIERYTDKQIESAVICERLLSPDNYNTIVGELKDAVSLDDYDLFIIGVMSKEMDTLTSLQNLNKARTLVCDDTEYDSAKNFIIMI